VSGVNKKIATLIDQHTKKLM